MLSKPLSLQNNTKSDSMELERKKVVGRKYYELINCLVSYGLIKPANEEVTVKGNTACKITIHYIKPYKSLFQNPLPV